MKTTRVWHITSAIALLAAPLAVSATDPGRTGTAPASRPPPPGAATAPLKGELRLSPGAINTGAARVAAPQTSLGALTQKFNELSGKAKEYEVMAKAIPGIAQQCAAKSYSVQDQMAAGCVATDTVAQCSEKLYKHCIQNFSNTSRLPAIGIGTRDVGGGQIGFSMQQFQQSAQATAENARALANLLGLYADQVEQNAKAALAK